MIGGSQQGQRRRRTLLLGVFHSRGQTQFTSEVRGQGYRDLVRCKALESQGHDVFTCDDKHTEGVVVGRDGREQPVASADQPGLHVQANFNDGRRMLKSMAAKPTFDQPFDTIILDYFFSPAGWAATRWTDSFFCRTIPAFAELNKIVAGGQWWLPYLDCVRVAVVEKFAGVIGQHYTVRLVSKNDVMENPLYAATSQVQGELSRCPEAYTNETQLAPLLTYSDTPFLVLSRRHPPRHAPIVIIIDESDNDDDVIVIDDSDSDDVFILK